MLIHPYLFPSILQYKAEHVTHHQVELIRYKADYMPIYLPDLWQMPDLNEVMPADSL